MLVKAFCLRHLGQRLDAGQLRAEIPMVGHLRYESNPIGPESGKGALTCLLMPLGGGVDPQVQLFHARVKSIDRRGVIILGIEEVWQRKRRTDYRQALWCWPVHPDELLPPPPDPIDAEEEMQALAQASRAW